MAVTLEDIRAARERIRDVIYHSPCPFSLSLSRLCSAEIYCKLDHLQITGSFKERGARNKLLLLTEEQRKRGVVAASAGNHALALAYHGQELGISVKVVMPRFAPLVKVKNCRSFNADVVLHGEAYADAKERAMVIAQEEDRVFVSGFDDPDIIAGQGTMGLEIVEDVPDLDAVIVPVGGGGLISGVGTAIKALRPGVQVIGVEPIYAPTLKASLDAGKVTRIDTRPTLADGLAVAEVGKLGFDIARHVIDDLVMVDEPQIAVSVLRLLELEKAVIEGAGAVPLAAALDRPKRLEGRKVVLCLCGGNIDVTLISRIIERGMVADGRLCRVTASVSDRPGSLARIATLLASTGASIKDVDHDREFGPGDVNSVRISITLETRDAEHIEEVRTALVAAGVTFLIS
jgi:threonine dehydratase